MRSFLLPSTLGSHLKSTLFNPPASDSQTLLPDKILFSPPSKLPGDRTFCLEVLLTSNSKNPGNKSRKKKLQKAEEVVLIKLVGGAEKPVTN